jgi:uncharacterized protein
VTEAATAPTPGVEKSTWGLWEVVLGFGFSLVLSFVSFSAVLGATGTSLENADLLPLWQQVLAQSGLWVGFIAVPLIVTNWKGRGLIWELRLRAKLRDFWVGLASGAVLQIVIVYVLTAPLLWLLDKDLEDFEAPARELADRADGFVGVASFMVIICIGAPIAEEIFFRGFLLRGLLKRGMSPSVSVVVTGLAFGLTHFQPLQFLSLSVVGFAFGWLALRYDRLGPAIAAHMAFNLVAGVALLAA